MTKKQKAEIERLTKDFNLIDVDIFEDSFNGRIKYFANTDMSTGDYYTVNITIFKNGNSRGISTHKVIANAKMTETEYKI